MEILRLEPQNTELLESLDALYRAFAVEEEHTAPPEHFLEFIIPRLADPTMLVALATQEGQGVGYALVFDVMQHPFIPDWQRSGYITQLFVHTTHRRQGIGEQLTNFAIAWLQERGVPQLMLNVDVDNPKGEKFWLAQGFTPYLKRMKRALTTN